MIPDVSRASASQRVVVVAAEVAAAAKEAAAAGVTEFATATPTLNITSDLARERNIMDYHLPCSLTSSGTPTTPSTHYQSPPRRPKTPGLAGTLM